MNKEKSYQLYENMLYIRMVEEAIVDVYPQKKIKTPVHLYIGQEAVAAGISFHLTADDYVMSNHRSHGHTLAKGLSLKGFFAELYGKAAGVSKGNGGSMHLVDMEKGVLGTSAIVAGGIPIGVGAAFKQKLNNEKGLTVIYFGDGAVDEGVFWESINFAMLQQLPVLFVMENNLYASQTHSQLRHGYRNILDIVKGYGMKASICDGNSVLKVNEAAKNAIDWIRSGQGPAFIQFDTYRWMGHVGTTDDTHTGYRTAEEVAFWREKCPLKQMETHLLEIDPEEYLHQIQQMKNAYQISIEEAIQFAEEMPYAVD